MATVPSKAVRKAIDYPCADGRPLAETDRHRKNLTTLIETLDLRFAADPFFYVSGNLLLYYVEGNKNKHVSPDVFVVRDIPRGDRNYYLLWVEGKTPDLAIELTSTSTREEDLVDKFQLYQDVLKVREYFLFDPRVEYLKPPLQGFRLRKGRYAPIRPVKGRLPSQALGLHLERDGWELRLYDPGQGRRLPTPLEEKAQVEAENDQLRREVEALRRRLPNES